MIDDLIQFCGVMFFIFAFLLAFLGPTLKGRTIKEKWNYFYEMSTRNNSY